MMEPGKAARGGALVLLLTLGACRGALPAEEARTLPAQFGGVSLMPPPREDEDPTRILGQRRDDSDADARQGAVADQSPPATSDPAQLAQFYYQRGQAAAEVGRTRQRITDLTRAVEYSALVRDPQ